MELDGGGRELDFFVVNSQCPSPAYPTVLPFWILLPFWSLLLWSNQNLICLAVSTKKGPFCSDALLFSFLLSLISLAISWQFSVLGVLFALNLSVREGETETGEEESGMGKKREKKKG